MSIRWLGAWILLGACNAPAPAETDEDTDVEVEATVAEIAVARGVVCWRWTDGVVGCDGEGLESEDWKPPMDGGYVDMDGAGDVVCGVLESGAIDCFGDYYVMQGTGREDPEQTVPIESGRVQVAV